MITCIRTSVLRSGLALIDYCETVRKLSSVFSAGNHLQENSHLISRWLWYFGHYIIGRWCETASCQSLRASRGPKVAALDCDPTIRERETANTHGQLNGGLTSRVASPKSSSGTSRCSLSDLIPSHFPVWSSRSDMLAFAI